jgi:hypothetical protein
MITSTQNGYNLFYRLYKAAEQGINEYSPFKTDWYEVPEWNPDTRQWETRDEAWHQLQVANYGSEEAFNAQFGTNFDISANTLIAQKILSKNQQNLVEFVEKEMPGVPFSNAWRWHPNFDPIDCKKSFIVMTTDIAEGGGGDSTVCSVHRFVDPGTNRLECIGFFKSNQLPREDATLSIQVFTSLMCNQDRTLLSFERNVYGEIFVKQMTENTEKNVPGCIGFDPSVFVKYYNEAGTKFHYGIKITSGNKTVHCKLYKEDYEKNLLVNEATQYMAELNNFSNNGNDKFEAAFGHDDMVMTEVQLTFVRKTLQYKLLKDEFEAGATIDMPDTIYNAFELFDPLGLTGYKEILQEHNIPYYDMYNIYDTDINNMYRRLNSI